MSRLESAKTAINNHGYVGMYGKNLEAIEAEIRADERKKVIDKIRELKKHSGNTSFCTKEYWPSHEDIACYDCIDAILNYAEKEGEKQLTQQNV